MAKATSSIKYIARPKVSRPGVHSKCKTSSNKNSKNYVKQYVGQGKR